MFFEFRSVLDRGSPRNCGFVTWVAEDMSYCYEVGFFFLFWAPGEGGIVGFGCGIRVTVVHVRFGWYCDN